MTLSSLLVDLKLQLALAPFPTLTLPNAAQVAQHFHLTEIGLEQKDFIDCGGTKRTTYKAVLQLLVANDIDHRLSSEKLLFILEKGCKTLTGLAEAEVEIELTGSQTIERYGVAKILPGLQLQLSGLATACLAPDTCNIDPKEAAASLPATSHSTTPDCTPNSGCC